MGLITRSTLPPGGWVYTQKGNDGKPIKELRSMSPFNEFAKEVLDMRIGNSLQRATVDEVKEDIDNAQCERLGFDPTWCAVKKKPISFQPVRLFKESASHVLRAAAVAGHRLGELSDGVAITAKWFGEGMQAVPQEVSQQRANICLDGCPFNKKGFRPVEAAADWIRRVAEAKNSMSLKVDGEENLNTCLLCWCHLPTKVHVPIETILSETPAAMMAKIKDNKADCWMVVEASKLAPIP